MKFRLILVRFAILLACLFSAVVYAEDDRVRIYWVLGSYAQQGVAMERGEQISQATGLEIVYTVSDVNNSTYYRLLVRQFDDQEDQTRLRLQLGYAGIDAPWILKMDSTLTRALSSPVAREQSLYLVLGSFKRYEDAQYQVDKILENFNQIAELREFSVNGESVIRVITGPYVDQAEVRVAREMFQNGQINDAWILRLQSAYQGMMSSYEADESNDLFDLPESKPDRESILREATRKSTQLPENTIDPGYNLARLKKRPVD